MVGSFSSFLLISIQIRAPVGLLFALKLRRCVLDSERWAADILTDSQHLQVAFKAGLFLQHSQQVGGFHALQLHLPVDVDFVVEADIDEAGPVFALLTCVLTCNQRKPENLTHSFYSTGGGSDMRDRALWIQINRSAILRCRATVASTQQVWSVWGAESRGEWGLNTSFKLSRWKAAKMAGIRDLRRLLSLTLIHLKPHMSH